MAQTNDSGLASLTPKAAPPPQPSPPAPLPTKLPGCMEMLVQHLNSENNHIP